MNQPFDQTFLTDRTFYREAIDIADTIPGGGVSTADNNDIPEIRLDVSTSTTIQYPIVGGVELPEGYRLYQCGVAGRAYNAHLELYCWFTPGTGVCVTSGPTLLDGVLDPLDARCHATVRVWAWGGDSGVDPVTGPIGTLESEAGTEVSSSSSSAGLGRWTLVHEQSILIDTLIVLRDIPANRYRVTVDFLTDGSIVDIVEQHTE